MKKEFLFFIVIIFVVLLLSSATTKVLVIGVGDFYNQEITKLPGALSDAQAFKNVVIEFGIADSANVRLIENPSSGVLTSEIADLFLKADPQDKLILYYSGHGKSEGNKTYLVPFDANPFLIEKTCYNLTDNLTELLAKTKAKEIIMIIDMCYAGSLIVGRPLTDPRYERTPLENLIKDLGVTMLLSSGASEISVERKEGGGWFTYYFLKGLKEEAGKGKEEISLRELFEYVRDKVSSETLKKQNPVFIGEANTKLQIRPKPLGGGTCILKVIAGNELAKTGTVYLNGHEIGKLTGGVLAKIDLPKGKYIVTVDGDKIEKWEKQIEFKADYEMQELKIEAQIVTRLLRVVTEPIGAVVLIDGKEVGMSPWQGRVEVGKKLQIKVVHQGYRTEEKTIEIPTKGEIITEKFVLKKNTPPDAPRLLEPLNNVRDIPLQTTLKWTKAQDPDGDEVIYDLYLGQEGNAKLIVSEIVTTEYEVKNLEAGKVYEWKVIAKDTHGAQTASIVQKFSTTPFTLKWKFQTGREIFVSPAIGADGTVYIGSYDSYLYAITPDGKLKWKFPTAGYVKSSPTVDIDGTIYVGTNDNTLFAIHPNGNLKWKFQTGWLIESTPSIGPDGTIYVGCWDKYLYAISRDGKLKWKFATEGALRSSPAIDSNGTIYIGSVDKHLYAITPDGKLKWKFQTGDVVTSSPAIGKDGTIYFGSQDTNIYALTPDGKLKWKFQTDGYIHSHPSIGNDGTIYIGSVDKHLYAINPNGTLKWRFPTNGIVHSGPAVGADNTIFVGSYDGCLYVIKSTGELKWKFQTDTRFHSSPVISSDGTVYIAGQDGYLYAFSSESKGLATSSWPKFKGNIRNTGKLGDK